MLSALSFVRKAAALFICLVAVRLAPAVTTDTVDLSLNVFYNTPQSTASGGTWELVAKSCQGGPCANFGISGITTRIRNIGSGASNEGPRGIVNGSNSAGFGQFFDILHAANPPTPAFHEIIVGQLPIAPLPPGNEQSLFYGVGTLANGSPGTIGPAFTSLTSPQDIPWATGDAFGNPAWNIGARLAFGTFPTGVTPAFLSGSIGNVFTAVGTSTTIGNIDQAGTVTTIVRTNFLPGGADYNQNGIVDAADYVIWRKTQNQPAVPPGSGADGNGDGTVNLPDYDLWRAHFGNPFGAGTGGGLFTNSVPEPAACILFAIGALLVFPHRQGRNRGMVNN